MSVHGVTQFMSREFQVFAKEWEIDHTLYNSPSNRNTESTVKDCQAAPQEEPRSMDGFTKVA